MTITMKEIAEKLGVNVSTVSRALNNDSKISEDMKNRIIDTANRYNYKRKKARPNTVSYVIDKNYFMNTNHFFNRITQGIEEELKNNNYNFNFNYLDSDSFTVKNMNMNMKKLAGLIITGCYHDDFILEIQELNIPMVLVDYYLPTEDISSVLIDNIDGIIIGMKYLASLGHKRIAYLKGEIEDIGSHDRLIGYYRALDMFGLEKDEELVLDCDFTLKGAYEATKGLLESPVKNPTAIMGVNDVAALGAMESIKEKDLRIPKDISVLGFDDIDMASEIIPKLSTMHVRKKTLGKLAVQTLLTQIHHEETEYSKVLINPKLIIRESTASVNE